MTILLLYFVSSNSAAQDITPAKNTNQVRLNTGLVTDWSAQNNQLTDAGRNGGACCVPDQGCWDVSSQEACINWGGAFNEGVPCAQINCGEQWLIGCCTDLGCFEVSPEECINSGGSIAGSIADCIEVCPGEDETCCTPNGCITMNINTCLGFGGTPYQNMGDCIEDCNALVCGDGTLQPPEECESNSDCPDGEECIDCTCENIQPDCPIEGYKWLDINGDGSHQNGEPGLSNWVITAQDGLGEALAATVTRAGGHYCFEEQACISTATSGVLPNDCPFSQSSPALLQNLPALDLLGAVFRITGFSNVNQSGDLITFSATAEAELTGFGNLVGYTGIVNLTGSGVIQLLNEVDGNWLNPVPVEMISLTLSGSNPLVGTVQIMAGVDNGLPSPGMMKTAALGNGQFIVETFFDVFYHISLAGASGSDLDGLSGETQRITRLVQLGQENMQALPAGITLLIEELPQPCFIQTYPESPHTIVWQSGVDFGQLNFGNQPDEGCCVIDADCDDGMFCTEDTCIDSECMFAEVSCDDDDPCTTDSCSESVGECVNTPITCNDMECPEGFFCLNCECIESICGDGYQAPDEMCDDGNTQDGDGCSSVCEIEYCGDGVQQVGLGEECDDGNTSGGDGCASDCTLESLPGDSNGDNSLDIVDVVIMVGDIMTSAPYNSLQDLNGDGLVNIVDVVELVNLILS